MFGRNIGAAAPSVSDIGKTPFRLISFNTRQTQPMFSDNSRVYYKPGSTSTVPGTVVNRRHIGKKT